MAKAEPKLKASPEIELKKVPTPALPLVEEEAEIEEDLSEELSDDLVPVAPSPVRLRPATDRPEVPIRSSNDVNSTLMGIPAEARGSNSQPYSHITIEPKAPAVDLADRTTAATDFVAWCEKKVASERDPVRKARLHFEQARLYETVLGDLKQSLRHYQLAHSLHSTSSPVLAGLIRVRFKASQWDSVLGPLREQIVLSERPEEKAALHALRAFVLETHLKKPKEARSEYEKAWELAPQDGALLFQVYRSARRDQDWTAVAEALGRWSRLAENDGDWAAALIAEQARVTEHLKKRSQDALPLYERAFELAPRVTSSAQALLHLYSQKGMQEQLVQLFQARAGLMSDEQARATELVCAGALLLHSGGSLEQAAQLLESAFSAYPDDRSVLYRLRQTYSDLNNAEGELSTLLRLEASATDSEEIAELNVAMGQLLTGALRRPADAVARFEKAISLAPPTQQSVNALVIAYEAEGNFEQVVAVLMQAEQKSESLEYRVEIHLKLARILEQYLSEPERAIFHYQAVLSLDADNQEAFRQLVRLLEERHRWEEVIELHERVAEHAANDEVFFAELFMIGDLLEHQLNAPERAISTYRRVLEKKPDHLGAFFRLQRAAQRAGQFDVLVEAYLAEAGVQTSKAQRLFLQHSAAQVCEEKLADHDRALVLYEQVLSEESLRKETLMALARYYEKHGRRKDQLDTLEKLLKVTADPHRRAQELVQMGRVAEFYLAENELALGYFKRAFELEPQNRLANEAVARVLHKTKKLDELAAHLEEQLKAVADPLEKASGYVQLGELYEWGLSRLPQALGAYNAALSEVPDHAGAHAGQVRVLEQRPDHEKTETALESWSAGTRDPALALWGRLRSAELSESLSSKDGQGGVRYGELLDAQSSQPQAVLSLLRSPGDAPGEVTKRALSSLKDVASRHALMRELLRLSMNETADEKLDELVGAILSLTEHDRFAMAAAELGALARGDEQALAQVDRWIVAALSVSEAGSAQLLASSHRTRLAEYLESKNAVTALQLLTEALGQDGANIGAARTLTRIAEVVDDAELLAQSAEREASVVVDNQRACRLLIRAAELLSQKQQGGKAAEHLRRALSIYPDSVRAAKALYDLLGAEGKYVELAAVLREAAENSRKPKVAVEHWISVAKIAADKRNDLGEAIFVLEKLEKGRTGNLHSSLALGDLFLRDRQWEKAVAQMQKSVTLNPDSATLLTLRLRLAEVFHSHLSRLADASRELKDVLKVNPEHQGALRRLLAIQMKEGAGSALETAQRLVAVSVGKERAEALLSLGRLQVGVRKLPEAVGSFCEAVELVGLRPVDASEELRRILGSPAGSKIGWKGYERALYAFAKKAESGEHQARVFRELGRVLALSDVPLAIEKLAEGLRQNEEDFALRRLYSELLKEQQNFEAARDQLLLLVQKEPSKSECWDDLVVVQETLLAIQEADIARGALVVLGGGSEHQKTTWRSRSPRFTQVPAGGIHAEVLNESLPEGISLDALSLLETLGNLVSKVYPPQLGSLGVNPKAKIGPRGNHPLRSVVDRASHCLGGPEVDLYVSDSAPSATLVLTDPLGLVLPSSIQNLSESEQLFVVTRLLVNASRRAEAVDALSLEELRLLLGAGARIADPASQVADVDANQLADTTRRLSKALPWLSKGRIEDAARRYAAAPELDVGRLRRTLSESAYRVALVFADDLGMVERMLSGRAEVLGLSEHQGQHLAQRLLAFWSSPQAFEMRRSIGIMQ